MITKQLTKDKEQILTGLFKAAEVVTSTMGGQGKTVILANNLPDSKLKFTKDGVTVADHIRLEDPLENIGAQILISAANKTVDLCGDGTTLTALMLKTMIQGIYEVIKEEDLDFNAFFEELKAELDKVVDALNEGSKEVKNIIDVYNIAKTSSNSQRIGELFSALYDKTGLDALVTVEKSEESDVTYYEVLKGIEFQSGYVHPSFMTDESTEQAIYQDAYIHVEENSLNTLSQRYEELLSYSMKHQIPLVIIAPNFSKAVIRVFSMQKVNQGAPVCLIKTPGFAYGKKKNAADINAFLKEDGTVDKITISPTEFIIYNEDTPYLEERLKQLEALKESTTDRMDEEDYKRRIYKLKTATAVIYAGGTTPEAQGEEKDRLDDAIGAVSTAVKYGYSLGGGIAFRNIASKLYSKEVEKNSPKSIIMQCLYSHMFQILSNANEDIKLITEKLDKSSTGYNVKTRKYEDFYESGVIDPTNVLITALNNAYSNTKLILNSDFTLFNEFQKNPF